MALSPEQIEQIRNQFLTQLDKFPEDQREQLKQQILNASPEQLEASLGPKESQGEEILSQGRSPYSPKLHPSCLCMLPILTLNRPFIRIVVFQDWTSHWVERLPQSQVILQKKESQGEEIRFREHSPYSLKLHPSCLCMLPILTLNSAFI